MNGVKERVEAVWLTPKGVEALVLSRAQGMNVFGNHIREGAVSGLAPNLLDGVEVDLIDNENGWPPYLSLADAEKLDEVRRALASADIRRAAQLARVFELTPIHA